MPANSYPVRQYTLLFDGTAQRLSSVFADPSVGGPEDVSCHTITLQPDGANANPVLIGDSAVAAGNFGFSLPAGAGGVPPSPFVLGSGTSRVKLSALYAVGTAGQKLRILLFIY